MQKRKHIKIALVILICIGCVVFLISQIKLEKCRERSTSPCAITSDLKTPIDIICNTYDSPEKIIEECSKLVCKRLSFAAKNDIPKGKANCVGYAQLTSAIINYAFQIKNLTYKAKPVVGKVYLFGIDLNNTTQRILPKKHRSFFKDHDFVEIDLEDKIIFIDTSLQDLTGYRFKFINMQKTHPMFVSVSARESLTLLI